jgi:hypothetical protein
MALRPDPAPQWVSPGGVPTSHVRGQVTASSADAGSIIMPGEIDAEPLCQFIDNQALAREEGKMIQVLLRIAVWVLVLGGGYLVFGPQLFDSSGKDNPFESDSKIFLPPQKTKPQIDYERIMQERRLQPEELAEYQALSQKREANFWQQAGVSVEEALSGIQRQRKQSLAKILQQRGMSRDEIAIFLMVVERDHPGLLADRD